MKVRLGPAGARGLRSRSISSTLTPPGSGETVEDLKKLKHEEILLRWSESASATAAAAAAPAVAHAAAAAAHALSSRLMPWSVTALPARFSL